MYITLRKNKKIKVNILGEGDPIIFIHSYLWDSNMWEPQLKELSKSFKCISIDLWGHGESDFLNKEDTCSLKELTEDIINIADQLNIKQFDYIGLSVGAMLGTYLALNYNNRIKKLVLMDGYSGDEPISTQEKYINLLNTIEHLKYIPEELANIIIPMFFSKNEGNSKGIFYRNFKNELMNKKEKNIDTIVKLGREIFQRENLLNEMKNIKNPTLFLVGDEDIPRPAYESLEMHKLVKNSKLTIIPNAGHISNLENPAFVNSEIIKFLNK